MALALFVPRAYGQATLTLNITADIIAPLTISETNSLDFGLISIVTQAGFTPNLTIDTLGNKTVAGEGGGAILHILGSGTGNPGLLDVDGPIEAAGVDINFMITSPTTLTGTGPSSFSLSNFIYNDQQGNSGAVALSTPVTVTLDGSASANILIGATLNSTAAGTYNDGVYSGTFDVNVFF